MRSNGRTGPWCGLICGVIALVMTPGRLSADITYNVQVYGSFDEAGWSVDGGTITTDGTLGGITSANILNWTINITSPEGSYSLTTGNSSSSTSFDKIAGLIATSTELSMLSSPTPGINEQLAFLESAGPDFSITYTGADADSGGSIVLFDTTASPDSATFTVSIGQTYVIASTAIPEPLTGLIVPIAGIAMCGIRRPRFGRQS